MGKFRGRIGTCGAALALVALAVGASAAGAVEPERLERWFGDSSSATGAALGHGACDVNGDGYDDAVVGAWFWDKAPFANTGAAYVLFGGPDVRGGDLNEPGAAGAARIDGPAVAGRFAGFSVACAGDVNGDDLDDLLISDYVENRAWVVLGAASFGSLDLEVLGDRGFVVSGPEGSNFGYGVFGAGDLNGDGLDEVAISGVVADTLGRTNNGAVWIVAGKEDVGDVDAGVPEDGEVLMVVNGRGDQDRLGSVAAAGDVDGDGAEDLVLGAYTSTPYGPDVAVPGQAWMVSGAARGEVDLAALDAADGFAIWGPDRQRDRLGISVAGAGDLNGDGLADLLVGSDGVSNATTGERDGSAWVIFGSDSGATVYTSVDAATAVFSCADPEYVPGEACEEPTARGYWIVGADSDETTAGDSTGFALDSIGDVNGDGIADAVIGAWGYDPVDPESADPPARLANAGAAWVVHGKADSDTLDLATLEPAQGYRIDGVAAGDRFGRQVAGLGDLDANGTVDFAAAGDMAQRPLPPAAPRAQSGEVVAALMPSGPRIARARTPIRVRPGKRPVLARIACGTAGACELAASAGKLRLRGRSRAVEAMIPDQVASGKAAKVRLKLDRGDRRALRRRGLGRLRLRVQANSPLGGVERSLQVKLKRVRR